MKKFDLNQYLDELRGLDTNNVGSWPLWVYVLSCIILAGMIIGLGQYYLVKPKREALVQAEAQEPQLKQRFEIRQKKVANLDAYKAQLAEMERSFGTMLRQLPSKAEIANLLNDISQTRVASGLEEELFRPQPEVTREFYAEVPNTLVVVGHYHELANFVSNVAQLSRIVTLHDIDIAPFNNKNQKGSEGETSNKLRMTLVAKTYRYLEEDELAVAEEPVQ